MKYLIDTDIIIDHLRGFRSLFEIEEILGTSLESMAISTVTAVEIYFGIKEFYPQKVKPVQTLINRFLALSLNLAIAKIAGEFRACYKLGLGDCIIAATAFVFNLILITKNIKHFKTIKGIKIKSI